MCYGLAMTYTCAAMQMMRLTPEEIVLYVRQKFGRDDMKPEFATIAQKKIAALPIEERMELRADALELLAN